MTLSPVLALMRSNLKFLPYVVIALLIGVVLFRSHQLENTREELKVEQDFRKEISDILKAPDAKPETVRTTARAVIQTSENRRVALQTIDGETAAAKKRADAADAELRRVQADNQRAFRAAAAKIRELEQRQPSGDPVKDQEQIADDSMAPWQGWTK